MPVPLVRWEPFSGGTRRQDQPHHGSATTGIPPSHGAGSAKITWRQGLELHTRRAHGIGLCFFWRRVGIVTGASESSPDRSNWEKRWRKGTHPRGRYPCIRTGLAGRIGGWMDGSFKKGMESRRFAPRREVPNGLVDRHVSIYIPWSGGDLRGVGRHED